jgi:hypothetical protein
MNSSFLRSESRFAFPLRLLLLILVTTCLCLSSQARQTGAATDKIPIIKMDSVPLMDAIKNLARQAQINYIVDPRILSSSSLNRSNITMTLTDVTAEQALDVVLKNHNLKRITNPATSITRIVTLDQAARPAPAADFPTDSGGVIPLIIMDDVPLADAISNLARQAGIKASFDPKLEDPNSTDRSLRSYISVRWEKVTAGQALASLLDNYDLEMKKDPAGGDYKITKKAQN